jgi:hypothetical protein
VVVAAPSPDVAGKSWGGQNDLALASFGFAWEGHMHHKISIREILLYLALLVAIALWVLCIYLLMETTKQLLDVLHYVVELAQLS